jgi:DNA-directed RNA polymerase specialized sigma24 family protein
VIDTQSEPPDDDLIRRIRRKDDLPAAKLAFATFFRRHVQFLFRCVRQADRQLVGYGLGTDDIVEETFANVWRSGANTFCLPSGLSAEAASRRTRQWLATIARNLIKDKLKSNRHQLPIDPTGENEALFATEEAPCATTPHIQLMQIVSAALSQRDAAIVWFKMRYYNPETRQSQPPPTELDAFCKEWEISPAALRKAYERALAALSQALSRTSVTHE